MLWIFLLMEVELSGKRSM